jgi:choline dehydrogenase-like flavoprotein
VRNKSPAGSQYLSMLICFDPGNNEYDWKFKTVPQADGRQHHMPRGKILGGSSGINFMMYVRGSLQDYDDWAIIADDPTWGSDKMNQYMRKLSLIDPQCHTLTRTTALLDRYTLRSTTFSYRSRTISKRPLTKLRALIRSLLTREYH